MIEQMIGLLGLNTVGGVVEFVLAGVGLATTISLGVNGILTRYNVGKYAKLTAKVYRQIDKALDLPVPDKVEETVLATLRVTFDNQLTEEEVHSLASRYLDTFNLREAELNIGRPLKF